MRERIFEMELEANRLYNSYEKVFDTLINGIVNVVKSKEVDNELFLLTCFDNMNRELRSLLEQYFNINNSVDFKKFIYSNC